MLRDILGNRYVLSDLLGEGGMAKVFLAHDRILGRDVALKVLREHYAEDEEFVERFRREAQSAAALSHPNVVQVYDQGRSEDGRYYIVMEYVPGGTLKARIDREDALDPGEAARLASQVAETLQAAHDHGIVHRDVKPHNVLLDAVGDAKVADFGIARAASTTAISRTNLVLGTASYMSPEQAMGEEVGPQSDLYSLGVVLYEMLTGEVPFGAESLVAIAMKHVTEPPQPPRELNPLIPEEMDALVMGLLAKKPEDRYGSAAELAEDLRRVRGGLPPAFVGAAGQSETLRTPANAANAAARVHGSTGGGAGLGSPRREPILRQPIRVTAALAALLALLGVLGWDLSRTPEGVGTVQALEGGPLEAPATVSGARGDDGGKGTGSGTSSAGLAGDASASASPSVSAPASASASVPAPEPSAPEPSAPEPAEPEPSEPEPSAPEPAEPEPSASVPASDPSVPEHSSASPGAGRGTDDREWNR